MNIETEQKNINLFGATIIRSVDPGFEVEFDDKTLKVTEENGVRWQNVLYVTHTTYEVLKNHPQIECWKEND